MLTTEPTQAALTDGARCYYDRQREDRNLRLSQGSGIINHHFGIGDFDRCDYPNRLTQPRVAQMLHELEVRQTDTLLAAMGIVRPEDRVLDAGCGRGGTTFSMVERFGASVDGITISPYQHGFAARIAAGHGWACRARFHLMNYLHATFPDHTFDHVLTNESTQYTVRLNDLFGEFARLLKPGGHYAIATWCINEAHAGDDHLVSEIDRHYGTFMHSRRDYLDALRQTGFAVETCADYTQHAIPYWELRSRWHERSGIEEAYLVGHQIRKILYLFITASRTGARV